MPQTKYQYRRIIFVQQAFIEGINQQAKIWDPDIQGGQTFGNVRLSSTGNEPATHTVCGTFATFQMKQAIDGQDNRPQVSVYDGEMWTYQQALIDMGLQIIVREIGT